MESLDLGWNLVPGKFVFGHVQGAALDNMGGSDRNTRSDTDTVEYYFPFRGLRISLHRTDFLPIPTRPRRRSRRRRRQRVPK